MHSKKIKLTRSANKTIIERVQKDTSFSSVLLVEALSLFANGEPETARIVLRDVVNSTIGFENLAVKINKPVKSLHRMLSAKGNPTMDNLSTIINVLCQELGVRNMNNQPLPDFRKVTKSIDCFSPKDDQLFNSAIDNLNQKVSLFYKWLEQSLQKALSDYAGYEINEENFFTFSEGKKIHRICNRNQWDFYIDEQIVLSVNLPEFMIV